MNHIPFLQMVNSLLIFGTLIYFSPMVAVLGYFKLPVLWPHLWIFYFFLPFISTFRKWDRLKTLSKTTPAQLPNSLAQDFEHGKAHCFLIFLFIMSVDHVALEKDKIWIWSFLGRFFRNERRCCRCCWFIWLDCCEMLKFSHRKQLTQLICHCTSKKKNFDPFFLTAGMNQESVCSIPHTKSSQDKVREYKNYFLSALR